MPVSADAAPVKPEKARQVALGVFASASVGTRSEQPMLELVWDGETTSTRTAADPAFYVFNRTDAPGFVVIAGDDVAVPLLGYSSENGFRTEKMPDHVRAWFAAVRQTILDARASQKPALAAWRDGQRADVGTIVRQLSTALWSQSPPFNDDCPLYRGERTVTGCVATAAAIVMHYNRWPDCGIGVVPAYTTSTYSISVPARTLRPYDYDLMLDRYDNGYTPAQAAETARLIADAGAICSIDYGLEATGGFTDDLLVGLVTYMRYSKQAMLVDKKSYSDREWFDLMKREVGENRPVIYGGVSDRGGHQFVLDGYTDGDYFHFNWGWGGYNNGWFYIGGEDFEFTFYQNAIIDLVKDPDGSSTFAYDLRLYEYSADGIEFRGLTPATPTIRRNEPFEVVAGAFANFGTWTFDGQIKLAVYDADGAHKEDISASYSLDNLPSMSLTWLPGSIPCRITGRIAGGDRIRAIYKAQNETEWRIMRRASETVQDEIMLTPEFDGQEIAASTSFAFDRKGRTITLSTIENAAVTLTASSGQTLFSADSATGEVEIDVSTCGKGTYQLSIAVEDASYTLEVVL